jgi:hypothetical protein
MNGFTFEVPIKAPSTSNLREHHMARHRRTDAQKAATLYRMPQWTGGALLVVTLTRVGPRRLDDDNLRGALKAVRDAVASRLRIDDASPLVRWEYAQEKGPKALVRIEGRPVTHTTVEPTLEDDDHVSGCGNGGEDPDDCSPACRKARTPGARAVEVESQKPFRPGFDKARNLAESCSEDFCSTSRLPGSAYCDACGKADAVPPPRVKR